MGERERDRARERGSERQDGKRGGREGGRGICTYAITYLQERMCTHARTRTRTRALARARAHTHAHTHACAGDPWPESLVLVLENGEMNWTACAYMCSFIIFAVWISLEVGPAPAVPWLRARAAQTMAWFGEDRARSESPADLRTSVARSVGRGRIGRPGGGLRKHRGMAQPKPWHGLVRAPGDDGPPPRAGASRRPAVARPLRSQALSQPSTLSAILRPAIPWP